MNLRYVIASILFLNAAPALAQQDAPTAAPHDVGVADGLLPATQITVVATGHAENIDLTGQPISIIGADELASIQGPDITRALQRLPGVSIARNGALGSATSLFIRGANSEQTLVLIDGVRVADVSNPGGGYDFGGLLTGGIGKIELLRGSNSVIWGSDAIGGVVDITSARINGAQGSVEYGTHNAVDAEGVAGVSRNGYSISVDGGYARTDGIAVAAGDTKADPYRQWHIGGNGSLDLASGLSLVAVARYADSRLGIDGYPAPDYTLQYDGEYQKQRQGSGRVGLVYTGQSLTLNGGIALADTQRDYFDPSQGTAPDYQTRGRSTRADMTGHWTLPAQFAVDFGADREWTHFTDTYDSEGRATLTSGHALLGYYGDRLVVAGGARVDSHSAFGTHWTGGANASLRLAGDVRLRGSYGEGFKAPSLYQLLSSYGNLALRPETSESFDGGIEKGDRNGALHAAVTYFHRITTNLIDYVDCYSVVIPNCATRPYGTYANIGRARAEGVEVETDARPTETLSFHAAYTYVKSTNETPGDSNVGKNLARRPRHLLSGSGDWVTPLAGFAVGADARLVGDSFDNAANSVRLASYFLVGLHASLPVTANLELFGRVENLGDVRYQTAAGYNSYRRTVFAGVRAKL